jgi:uncharacterized protein
MAGTITGTTGPISGGTADLSSPSRGVIASPQVELLVLQPTPFCNIDCSYCYLPARQVKRRMTAATIARAAEVVCGSRYVKDRLTVIWHAGEPLVLPIDYYREAFATFARFERPGLEISQDFQTNGTLLDDAWVEFIATTGARIGVSIDGPQPFHDRYRQTRSGRGTHTRVLRAVERLVAARIDFHVITVLTADALSAPDEFFDFYVAQGIRNVGFNVEEVEGPHTKSTLQAPGSCEAYASFMRRIMARINASPPGTLSIREITGAFGMIADAVLASRRNQQIEPLGIVSVDVDGNLSTFSPELLGARWPEYGNFLFGNVHEHSLDDVLAHPALLRTHAAIDAGVRRCADTCTYFDFCGGGAPANKLFENGNLSSTETLYCRLTKQVLFDLVLEDLEHGLGMRVAAA